MSYLIKGCQKMTNEEYIDLKYYKMNDSQKETSNQWDMC